MTGDDLRARLAAGPPVVMPGVWDALSTVLAAEAGFDTVFMSGYCMSGTQLAAPDIGLLTQPEVADIARRACAASPATMVVVDTDTGYGNPLNVARTVARGADLAVTTEAIDKLIVPALIERSRSARILVVGSRGIGAFQRGLLGSVGTAVTRHAHCPVAVIHADAPLDAAAATRPYVVSATPRTDRFIWSRLRRLARNERFLSHFASLNVQAQFTQRHGTCTSGRAPARSWTSE